MKIGKYEINDGIYDKLNAMWKSYTRSVLQGEVGELKEFVDFIAYSHEKIKHSKLVGGVLVSPEHYENTERIKPLSQVDFTRMYEPLKIDEMKDIDSIVEAIQERIYYTGNIILGNSRNVEKSTSIFDSIYIYRSAEIYNTKYSMFSERVRNANVIFGSGWGGEYEFTFNLDEAGLVKRAFSVIGAEVSSDIFYSSGIINSQEVMFSFGIYAKHNVIGNRELPPDKYLSIKKALLEQLRDELKKNKRVPLLIDLVGHGEGDIEVDPSQFGISKERTDVNENEKELIDKSFSSVTKTILGKEINDVDSVKNTLMNRVPELVYTTSRITGKKIQAHEDLKSVKDRVVEYDHIFKLSELVKIDVDKDLSGIFNMCEEKMFICNESRQGENGNLFETIIPVWAHNAYRSVAPIRSKYIAYSYWPTSVEHGYGVSTVLGGTYIINVYTSKQIKRGFEVDNSRSSSDIYYCHNCEDVQEGMFSFNVKGKRNVIGNAELDSNTYHRIKKSLLEQIAEEFANNKLKYDIYTIVE